MRNFLLDLFLEPVSINKLLELLSQIMEVLSRGLHLLSPGNIL